MQKHINLKGMKKDEYSTQINICISRVLTDSTCWHTHQTMTPLTHVSLCFLQTHTHTHTDSLLVCVWVWARALCQVSAQCGTPLHVSTRWTHLCLLHTHTLWQLPGPVGYNTKTQTYTLFISHTDGIQKDLYIHSYINIRCQSAADGGHVTQKNNHKKPSCFCLWINYDLIFYTIHFNCYIITTFIHLAHTSI